MCPQQIPIDGENRLAALERDFRRYRQKNEALKETKRRFYTLSHRARDGIYTLNLSINKYTYTNPAFIKIFGHPCKDIVTTESVMERILPEDRPKLKNRIDPALLMSKDGDVIEYRCLADDEQVRWMQDRWVVLRDDQGVPTAIEGIVRDVTEMKNIIGLKDYLESILESCMDAIIVTNEAGAVTLANQGAEKLLNTDRTDLVGDFLGDILKNDTDAGINLYEIILAHAPMSNYEVQARIPGGSLVPLLISSTFLNDANDQTMGTISYIRDIS